MNNNTATLARSITRAGSKQAYYQYLRQKLAKKERLTTMRF